MDMRKTTLQEFKAEIERLLVERGLEGAWATELVSLEGPYVERVYRENGTPEEVAKETYITKADADAIETQADIREPHETGIIQLKVSDLAGQYLQQLVQLGLWGHTAEDVARCLINRQLADLMASGIITRATN